jgi:hypothetical protein
MNCPQSTTLSHKGGSGANVIILRTYIESIMEHTPIQLRATELIPVGNNTQHDYVSIQAWVGITTKP